MRNKVGLPGWLLPAAVVGFGMVCLVLAYLGGNADRGVAALAVTAAYGGVLLLGGRSEVVRLLRGQSADERYEGFGVGATAFSAYVTVTLVLGMGLYEIARGEDGQPYTRICLVSGASYLAALLWLRWRS